MWKIQITKVEYRRTNYTIFLLSSLCIGTWNTPLWWSHLVFWESYSRSISKASVATNPKVSSKILEIGLSPRSTSKIKTFTWTQPQLWRKRPAFYGVICCTGLGKDSAPCIFLLIVFSNCIEDLRKDVFFETWWRRFFTETKNERMILSRDLKFTGRLLLSCYRIVTE